jgi:glycosyltransferase involved in cell wall biosynthesis
MVCPELKDWLAEESKYIDYIYLHRPHISENYIDFINALVHRPRTIYFGHDLHFLRTQREAELHDDKRLFADAQRWKSREVSLFQKVDLSLYPSAVEVEEVKKIDQSINVSVIPLNIYSDVGSLADDDVAEEFSRRTRITFVGGFGHPPNKDAMKWFVTDVMPLITRSNDAIVLSIVGSAIDQEIAELTGDHVQILGTLSDEQLSNVYSETKIAVVPLRFGAGVKGKVLESLNNGVPVVTTRVGAEGLPEVEHALKIEDDAALFASAVLSLYESEVLWAQAVRAGYGMISGHFSRDTAIRALQPFFDKG